MEKIAIKHIKYLEQVNRILKDTGVLLVSAKKDKSANVMTIGWGLIGRLWERDFALVAVRPSRYTFNFIEESGEFTINIPTRDLKDVVEYCGSVSGRDEDKFEQQDLILMNGRSVRSPIIEQCCLHYECRVAYKTRIVGEDLPEEIVSECYPQNDFHTLYFGEILKLTGDKDVENKLT